MGQRVRAATGLAASMVIAVFTVSCHPAGKSSSRPAGPAHVSVRFPIPIVEAGQTPFYVAQDKGYYAAENLDVKFEMGSPELNPVKMVASGKDTLGVLGGPAGRVNGLWTLCSRNLV